jgi:S-methylmethionine-dependent homocysteine/selenocysteine methylase
VVAVSRSPLLDRGPFVTDGGLETDLIFNRGVDLPEFAAFPLLDDAAGRSMLEDYYAGYADVARRAGRGLFLETPTWRANPDWATRVGYDLVELDRVNRQAVAFVRRLRDAWADLPDTVLVGNMGPRGDGYAVGEVPDPDEAAEYHSHQVRSFAEAGAELVSVLTLTSPQEGIGVVRAARDAGVPVAIGFTLETDGTLPDGSTLREAVETVDAAEAPDWYVVNCAHPTHVEPAFDGGDWQARIAALRPNASTLTHAELDEMEVLDEGDLDLLTSSVARLRASLPALSVLGGCCGTDARHVAALWGVV